MNFPLKAASVLRAFLAFCWLIISVSAFGQQVSGFTVNPNSVQGGVSTVGKVTISAAAPAGGFVVSLANEKPVYITMPASLTIAAGATTGTFPIGTNPFRTNYTDFIQATGGGSTITDTLNVIGDPIITLNFNPTLVEGGNSSTGTVTLSIPAPPGGAVISLSNQVPTYVSVPATVTIPGGSSSTTFVAATKAFRSTYTDRVVAGYGRSFANATLTVSGTTITSVTLDPTTVTGGYPSTGTVTISTPAPTGGATISFTTQIPGYVPAPASITIPAGATSGNFTVTPDPFKNSYTCAITADYGSSYGSATLTVTPIDVSSVSFNPPTVQGGESSTGTVFLSTAAPPSGAVVALTSQIPNYVTVPATITIPSGSVSGTFTATTSPFRQTYTAKVTATFASSSQSGSLTITGDPISELDLVPTSVVGGASTTGTVTLTTAAPPGGATVSLSSQLPNYVTVPASIVIPAGETTASFTASTLPYSSTYTCVITADYGSSYGQATLTVVTGLGDTAWPKFRANSTNTGVGSGSGATGVQFWNFVNATGDDVASSPAIGSDGTIYIGSNDDNVYALNGADGTLKWEYATSGSVDSSPAIGFDGTVYVGSNDHNVYALDGQTGAVTWSYATGGWVVSSPLVGPDGTVYVGSDDGYVYALNGQTGVLKWKFLTSGFAESSPAMGSDGTLYVGGGTNMYALNSTTGAEIWTYATGAGIYSSPAIGNGNVVYFGSGDDYVYAIDGKFGTLKWKYLTGNFVESSPAIGSDGTIYIGSYDDYLYALNGTTGALKWQLLTGGYLDSSVAIASDGTLYVGCNDGYVYSVNPSTGAVVWKFGTNGYNGTPPTGYVTSAPAVGSDGTVYVGSAGGYVYALH